MIRAARYIVLVTDLAIMLLRPIMVTVVIVVILMLLGHIVHIIESLVILTSIHEVLSLIAILAIDTEVVHHIRAGGRSRRTRRVSQDRSARPVRRSYAIVVSGLVSRKEVSSTRLMEAI